MRDETRIEEHVVVRKTCTRPDENDFIYLGSIRTTLKKIEK